MKRVIKSFAKATDEFMQTIAEKYPDGFKDKDFIFLNTANGERIKVLEMTSENTIYLVKFDNYSVADLKDIDDVEKWIDSLTDDDENPDEADDDKDPPDMETNIDELGEEYL